LAIAPATPSHDISNHSTAGNVAATHHCLLLLLLLLLSVAWRVNRLHRCNVPALPDMSAWLAHGCRCPAMTDSCKWGCCAFLPRQISTVDHRKWKRRKYRE